ncbi:MAG TPA: (E)-4-hydroxy-3-methylbut-2-enyl-diphosphate synthase [Bacteroidales bacterium]|nr:(E)-4-hydroxy-3-methylbut-2-enyl-diphosphate synthase [Bacteroidales bacterium]
MVQSGAENDDHDATAHRSIPVSREENPNKSASPHTDSSTQSLAPGSIINMNNLQQYLTPVIYIGSVPLGGNNPIRIQSMTNTDTLNTKATVAQCIRIIEAGADFIRLTAQGIKEAANLESIKRELGKAGFSTPLIADIHFNPSAAETAARIVEKVRINPGNYADKRASFEKFELTDKEYNEEIERTHKRLLPLINICREHGTVVRIGINHGSLSDRIMTRYGNTPEGMVSSALEFINIFRAENFNALVLSMKSSDTSVMIRSTRMLVTQLQEKGYSYPLHLGVTEAGEGEDGRVRSAAGIGALLSEGIGDTIRVSLSEDPEKEIPVARKIINWYPRGIAAKNETSRLKKETPSFLPGAIKDLKTPLVIAPVFQDNNTLTGICADAGFRTGINTGNPIRTDGSADIILLKKVPEDFPGNIPLIVPANVFRQDRRHASLFPLYSPETFPEDADKQAELNVIHFGPGSQLTDLKKADPQKTIILFSFDPGRTLFAADKFLKYFEEKRLNFNVILNPVFSENEIEDLRIKAASLLGKYVTDKRIAGIAITNNGDIPVRDVTALSFSILQCTETRITRTMYLSCPTCGRTKFNLQESVKKVREATGHLKGLKIAVMGCVVNGPGEMAGADYGYVGAAGGKVHIYRGTVPVLKNIPEKDAVNELLKIIESDNCGGE